VQVLVLPVYLATDRFSTVTLFRYGGPGQGAAFKTPQISGAGCAQTGVSACAVVAGRRCRGGLSRCVTECSSPSRIVGVLLTVGLALWTADGVGLSRCSRLRRRSFSTDVPDNVPKSRTAACPFLGPRQASQSAVPNNRPISGGCAGPAPATRHRVTRTRVT